MATSHLYSGSHFWPGEELAAILDSHPRWTADVFNKFLQRLKRSLPLRIFAENEDMKFWICTSGFQYAEWKGNFYPEKLPNTAMLGYYAEHLGTVEINNTFYRLPRASVLVLTFPASS